MCAAQNGHAHVCKLLLQAGADAGARLAPKGLTALDLATQGGHDGAAALLRPVTPVEFEQGL
jgi:ankyrin repeat protein